MSIIVEKYAIFLDYTREITERNCCWSKENKNADSFRILSLKNMIAPSTTGKQKRN